MKLVQDDFDFVQERKRQVLFEPSRPKDCLLRHFLLRKVVVAGECPKQRVAVSVVEDVLNGVVREKEKAFLELLDDPLRSVVLQLRLDAAALDHVNGRAQVVEVGACDDLGPQTLAY